MKSSQIERNQSSAHAWTSYTDHRARVMQVLKHQSGEKVTLLGAGNCNDVDLRELLDTFMVVRLVDIDEAALGRGQQQQGVDGHPRLDIVHRDLSGIASLLNTRDADLATCVTAAQNVQWGLEGDQDVVASMCVWTQILDAVACSLSSESEQILPLVLALRQTHLDRMLGLLRPGGHCWLITDIVSSDTVPELLTASSDLAPLMKRLLVEGNFFTGANPLAIREELRTPPFRDRVAGFQLAQPWLWKQGQRTFLCTAIGFRRNERG